MSENVTSGQEASTEFQGPQAHIMPVPVLLTVFGSLIALTLLTVAATHVNLGSFNLWVAMGIAGLKGTLVALYFMHLRYDRLFYGFLFMAALMFVFLLIGLILMDTTTYQPELIPGFAPDITQ